MKQAILILALAFSLSAPAQMKTLFFGQDWSQAQALTDSLLKDFPGYHVDTAFMTKSDKVKTVIFKNASGEVTELQILRSGSPASKVATIQIMGQKEPLLALYKQYFKNDVSEAGGTVTVSLNEAQKLPVTLFPHKGDTYVLASKNPY